MARQVEGLDCLADPLPDLDRDVEARIAQEHSELLATVAGRHVVLADGGRERTGHGPQDLVANRVPIRVVEDLEPVDVDHQDADGVVGPPAASQQGAELVEVATVG